MTIRCRKKSHLVNFLLRKLDVNFMVRRTVQYRCFKMPSRKQLKTEHVMNYCFLGVLGSCFKKHNKFSWFCMLFCMKNLFTQAVVQILRFGGDFGPYKSNAISTRTLQMWIKTTESIHIILCIILCKILKINVRFMQN